MNKSRRKKSLALLIILLSFAVFTYAKSFTYQEYYDYAKTFFWRNNTRCTIGDDNIFAAKLATDLYEKQIDLDKLKQELQDSDIHLKAINQITHTKELREWFVVNKKMGYEGVEAGDNNQAIAICREYKIDDVNRYIEAYQLDNIETLNKKWKDKPMPDYLEKAYNKNKRIIVNKGD